MFRPLDVNYLGNPGVIASCLLEGGPGGLALVDPGPSVSLDGLRAALGAQGRELGDVGAILLTHIHLDHAGATGTIVRRHPWIRVYVHERGAPHVIDPGKLLQSASRLYGSEMDRLWGEVAPVPEPNVYVLRGGERIEAGRLEVAYTPGHASHHVSYFDRETGTAFVGDTAGVRIGEALLAIPPTPPPDIDLEAWSASIDAVLSWQPARLFLTHFGAFERPPEHLEELRARTTEIVSLATEILANTSLDDAGRMSFFAAALKDRIAGRTGEHAATAISRAIPFEHCWMGLVRYLRKQSERRGQTRRGPGETSFSNSLE